MDADNNGPLSAGELRSQRGKLTEMLKFFFCLILIESIAASKETGLYVSALWLLQQYGTSEAADATNDVSLKSVLAKAIATDSIITFNEIGDFMSRESFQKIAGNDASIDAGDITRALNSAMPGNRAKLNSKVRSHAEYLTTTFDMIDEQHRETARKLALWIESKYETNKSLDVIVVCTGNSRRSILGSSMGNLAAAYYGLNNLRFYSGGTAPSAFNFRTVTALQEVGFDVEATGKEARRGDFKTPNPMYRVKWGEDMEVIEFSKHYADEGNPHQGFAALMVCTEADTSCPNVAGAALRLSMPYLDPKTYDDSVFESAKYAERRDDIGRTMLSAMGQVRRAIDARKSE